MAGAAAVFCIDDAYVMPFKVFFHSLEATNSIPQNVPLFILHTASLCSDSTSDLSKFLCRYQRKANFLDASSLIPCDLPVKPGDHVSPATYYRLFVSEILPDEIHQAVYLDADMLALKSIADLFTDPVDGLIAAADHCSPWNGLRLWGDLCGSYFQAGVLSIPLDTWRAIGITARFVEVLRTEQSRILWWDQDVLNIALQNRWQRLPIWYNVCEAVLQFVPAEAAEESAHLIHYSGSKKPWNSLNSSPFTNHWDEAYAIVYGKPFERRAFLPSPR